MARIYSNEGLILNQNNSNAFMRIYSCGKNNSGPYYKFNIATSNPHIYINMNHYYSFTIDNNSQLSGTNISGLYFDTSGNGTTTYGGTQSVVGSFGYFVEYTISSREAIVTVGFTTADGAGTARKGSIISHIFCNRWDYVTITQL
jgi:hypothetical protein